MHRSSHGSRTNMPSCKEVRAEQQRSRRQQFGLRNPWNSPGDIAMRAENLSRVHKSRLAHMVKHCIMCGENELTNRMTDALRNAFKKHPSLINYKCCKCHLAFCGMPKVFGNMEKRLPQRVMANPPPPAFLKPIHLCLCLLPS